MAEIIVEDGSNVAGANSYASVETVRKFCTDRGLSVSDSDDEVAQMILLGMDYLEAKEDQFKGYRSYDEQSLAWPRANIRLGRVDLNEYKIPKGVVNALCQLTVEATALDGDLTPSQTTYAIKQEVLGPMSTTYAVDTINANAPFAPVFSKVNAFLRPFIMSINRAYR